MKKYEYEVVFPATVFVEAKNKKEAIKEAADKASWDYFTEYKEKDCISIKIIRRKK